MKMMKAEPQMDQLVQGWLRAMAFQKRPKARTKTVK